MAISVLNVDEVARTKETTAPTAVQRWMVMGMANKCDSCTQKCPQSERAHQAALGRMYATNEFIALLKKVESGELVEVVRCKDCKHRAIGDNVCIHPNRIGDGYIEVKDNDFCSYGERREGE